MASGARADVVAGATHQELKREPPVIAQHRIDGVEVEHELREAAGSVCRGRCTLVAWALLSHLRDGGRSSLVWWCCQCGEHFYCATDTRGGQQTGRAARRRVSMWRTFRVLHRECGGC